jgi:hypothetical protein
LTRSIRRGIAAANRVRAEQDLPLINPSLRLYDLTRHTFGTELFRTTHNLKVVQDLMGHSDIEQSARYAMAAIREDVMVGIGELSRRVKGGQPATKGGMKGRYKVSPRPATRRNRTRQRGRPGKPE